MPRKTLAKGSFRPRSTGRVPPWLRRLLSVLMLGLLGFAQSCGTGPDGDSNIGQQSLPIGENCSLVSPEFLGSGDGCDCPSDGDTSCDPDCAVENEGGGYCGCEFCYGTPPPPGPECGQVPAEFRDIRDGCDCPWDGDTSCDPDCIFDGNSGGADCGCEFCHGAPPPVPEPPTFPTLTAPPAVPAPALKSTNASGALPGGGEVSQDGAYTYSIPIEVPRGRAGVEPNISLEYSSRGANGIMGMGWSILGAGSSISRCARINAAGRLTDRVNFDSDRYCLDGQRLLVVSGSYGAPGSEYRTEIDIFAKIVLVSTVPGSGEPIEFKVYYKDGRIGTFSALLSSLKQLTLNPDGSTSATRNVQLVWPLTKLVDRAGNAMTYVYQLTSDSLPIIRHIDYTSCDTTPCAYPSARLRRVQFDYEARAAEDRTERWVNGVKIFSAQRLKEISTFIANGSATTATFERIHRYALSYVQGGVSGRTLLRGIQKCDGASSPVCLPETRFVWNGEASANFAVTTAGAAFTYNLVKLEPITKRYQLMPENTFSVFDVNGDGNDDVVYKSWASSTLDMSVTNQAPQDRLLLADGNGYFAASVPIDPDGDGVAKTGCAGAEVMNPSTAQPSDMDGDGRIEWLAPLNTGCAFVDADTTAGANWTRVQPGTSAGITLEGQANRTMGILAWDRSRSLFTRVSVPTSIGGPSGVTWSRYELRLADVTGDGLPDLLDALLSNSDHWNVSIARKVVRSPTLDPQIDYQARRVGEDLGVIHVPMLGLPTKENALFNPTSFRVLDENGDGRAELIQIDNAGERRSFEFMNNADTIVYRHRKEHSPEATSTSSTPSGGPALPNWGTPNFGGICCGNEPGYWFPVDVNGDGLKDALYETSSAAGSEFRLRMNTGRGYGPAVAVGGAAAALSQYPKDHFYNASIGGAVTIRGRDTGLRIADMNYDGREDLVLLDPLLETQVPPTHGSGYQVATADFRVAYSNGTGFNAPVTIAGGGYERLFRRHEGFLAQFGDVNGDGLNEMLDMVAVPGDATKRRLVVFRRQIAAGGLDVIRTVTDERGDAEAVTYDNMSAGTAKRFASSTTPDTHVSDLSSPSPTGSCHYPASCVAKGSVVKQYENFRSERQLRNVYRYFGARADVAGRGWLGFARASMHDTVTNFLFTNYFDLLPVQGTLSGENGPAYHLYPRAGTPTMKTVAYNGGTSPASDLSTPENWHYRAITDTLTFSGYPVRLLSAIKLTRVETSGTVMRLYDTTTEYDDFGNAKAVTSRGSTVNSIVSADTHEVTTTNYDNLTSNWLIGLRRKVVETTKTKDDAFGLGCIGTDTAPCSTSTRTTDYEYYPNGLLKKIIREPGAAANTGFKLTTEFIRDTAGLATSVNSIPSETGAVTRTERTVFDESGANVVESSNALGHKTWFLYQPKTRWRYATADQNGPSDKADLLIVHDNMGRVRERRQADGAVETIDYGVGVERRAIADGPSSATFFDTRRRPTLQTWSAFSPDVSAVAETVYNSLGKVVKTQYREAAQTHATLSATEASARAGLSGAHQRSAASYDAMARLRTSTNGLAEVTTFTYPSPIGSTTSVDPSGYIRKTFADHAGRVRWLKQTLTGPQTRELFTAYGYDDQGEVGHIKTPDGARDVMQRDRLGRLLERRQYTATGSGNVLNRRVTYTSFDEIATEAHGGSGTGTIVASLLRDGLGRVTERRDAGAASGAELQTFVWDPAGALGQLRRASSTGAAGSYQHTALYGYDALGRLSEKREVFPTAGPDEVLSFGYTYDGRGRLDTLRYPETSATDSFSHPATGGLTLKYAYQNGQLKTIRDNARPVSEQPIWQVSAREAYGDIRTGAFWTHRMLGRVYTRDPNTLRLSTSLLYTAVGPPLSALQEFSYQANGLLSRRELNDTVREDYVYDTVSRLSTYERRNNAVPNTQRISATFHYDDVGNIKIVDTTASDGSPDWPNVDEQYTLEPNVPNFVRAHTIGGVQSTYVPDDAGRVARQLLGTAAQREYTYTTFDLPRTISQPALSKTTTLAYTAHHFRSRKTTTGGAGTSDVLYLGNLYEQRKTTTGGTVNGQSVFRIMGEDGVLVEVVHPWNAGSAGTRVKHLIVSDHQGSPALSSDGSTLTTLGFLPFGKRAGAPPLTPPASAVGYTGHIQDDDLGLINMQGRLYDVTQRRFISRDPLADTMFHSGGLNPYAYALNNPLNRFDPNGFQSHECGGPDTSGQGAGTGDTGGGDRGGQSISYDGGTGGGGGEGEGREGGGSEGGGNEGAGSQAGGPGGGGSQQGPSDAMYQWGDQSIMPDMSHIPESEMDEVVINVRDSGSGTPSDYNVPTASGTEFQVGPGGAGRTPDGQASYDPMLGAHDRGGFNLQLSYDITGGLFYGGQLSIGVVLGTQGANGIFSWSHGYTLSGNFGPYFNTGWSATAYFTDNIKGTQPVSVDVGSWAITVPVNPDSGPQGIGIGLGSPSLGAYVANHSSTEMAPLGVILPAVPYTAPGGQTFFPY